MGSKQQLLDSLTAHISVYHSRMADRNENSAQNSSYRPAVLRWFSSLSVHQRRAHLTVFDREFIAILLKMNEKIRSRGHGRFIILPDLPQPDCTLPTLCFRKSEGLLARLSELDSPGHTICESLEFFSSKEGGSDGEGNGPLCIDVMCLKESVVNDVNEFVAVMDAITNGEFLGAGEESEMAGEWVELRWLKAKGYYSLEEFVANRLEVALRVAWMNFNGGKKRGVKLKEKLSVAGVAANLFWRKKGCVDWWERLDDTARRKVYNAYFGKASRSLISYIVKNNTLFWDDNIWCCDAKDSLARRNSASLGKNILDTSTVSSSGTKFDPSPTEDPSALHCIFNSLYILQVLSSLISTAQTCGCDSEKLFFSSLDSVNSIRDIIQRKLRETLLVVSLDCTKSELLEEENVKPHSKKNEKSVAQNRKKKCKNNKKSNLISSACLDDSKSEELTKDKGNGNVNISAEECSASNDFISKVPEEDLSKESRLSAKATETVKEERNGKLPSVPRKSRKEKKKLKNSSFRTSEISSCQPPTAGTSSSSSLTLDDATMEYASKNVTGNGHSQSTETDSILCLNCDQNTGTTMSDKAVPGADDSLESEHDSGSRIVEPLERCADAECLTSLSTRRNTTDSSWKQVNDGEPERKTSFIQDQARHRVLGVGADINSTPYVSYEWPSIAPFHQLTNAHLPAATDRLHLDIGHNLQNHFHHSFLQKLHARKPTGQSSGYNGIIRSVPVTVECPPSIHCADRCIPSYTCNYDTEFISRRQSFQSVSYGAGTSEDERKVCGEILDVADITNTQEQVDEHWMSEEDSDTHALGMLDYNQYFGGGVMYWNPSDCPLNNFSRPPSLCSDDSSWAWREADMNRTVDDMVTFSSSYSGLTSPSAASFCSPFDPLGPGNISYVLSGSEINGKILHSSKMTDPSADETIVGSLSNMGEAEVKTVDTLPYPILRPIIIPNMSREKSRSEFRHSYDRKSPGVPPTRREHPRIKRPPSPVVLCVPSAPRPPPPSPVGDSRKHRGFPTVRSGSSSPRHWGMKSWFHDGVSSEEVCIPMEGTGVFWPPWRNKGISARQLTQPLAGKLLQERLVAICQLARDREHPDVKIPLQPPESQNHSMSKVSQSLIHDILHDEINSFCKKVATENMVRKPYINWAVKRVARSLQVLWPRSRTNVFGSNATGLALPSSDVDLVICLPPVRNLEPIKEAGILEGRNGIKETCLQHAARYLANQEWVKSDSLKIVENTAIPIIMVTVEVPHDIISTCSSTDHPIEEAGVVSFINGHPSQSVPVSLGPSQRLKSTNGVNDGFQSVRLDISFKSPTHSGLQTTGLVKDLTEQFPVLTPLALVLKQFLADRGLDQSYSGGLNSYCLILLITRFLQHEHHHGRPINQNYGSLLMDFLNFFGNLFDPKQMRISVQGSGVYLNRERGCSIDPLHIDDPLLLTNNVGRNCFRIHQCIKAFADAYAMLENELISQHDADFTEVELTQKLLPKLIPSMAHLPD